eukprot:CAMPEP_0206430838 /NCGR_PEP_ID=MMETSP0324_2-20121206/7036_1 /ASSEMBLY_ACC=CAM_ASM_000836 /TAXON_ID=2866 /ORGANISM="Crypthecodinium cohnii, Strain Seligo" /LENGTH=293 /DNA_ID=CAMNT_0053896709 /DNA_START=215 /DNA_END=1096 /DNA_ORIENTATION=+
MTTDTIVYRPEDFSGVGAEIFVVVMVISWVLTYFFNPAVLESNPLKDRVGYNNICVGWDTAPARWIAAPIYSSVIVAECRFMQLCIWRAALTPSMTNFQKWTMRIGLYLNSFAWFASIGIFSIDAMESPFGHTLSFVQLVVFRYFAFLLSLVESDPATHPPGSWVFTFLYGVSSIAFGICAMIQMTTYDPETKTRGPVPVYVMMFLDYGFFVFMSTTVHFRPKGALVRADYKLATQAEFEMVQGQEVDPFSGSQMRHRTGQQEPALTTNGYTKAVATSTVTMGCCGGGSPSIE